MQGYIIKGYSGFYYVYAKGNIYECSLRGKNRQNDLRFLPGDIVEFEAMPKEKEEFEKGVIEKVVDRRNELARPPIANVDQLIIAVAAKNPEPDYRLIDRMTLIALWNGIEPVICFNKADLSPKQDDFLAHYKNCGFKIIFTSTVTGEGIDELKDVLKGKISVFAGNSGVGKSSLLNAIGKSNIAQTGKISTKLKRGKHTTRHVELFALDDHTFLADTPGFSALELPKEIKREELSRLFPEFMLYLSECKFATCLHRNEPSCKVRDALEEGEIAQSRYENYLVFLEEVIANERSY